MVELFKNTANYNFIEWAIMTGFLSSGHDCPLSPPVVSVHDVM